LNEGLEESFEAETQTSISRVKELVSIFRLRARPERKRLGQTLGLKRGLGSCGSGAAPRGTICVRSVLRNRVEDAERSHLPNAGHL
jgi:hypothetical protein